MAIGRHLKSLNQPTFIPVRQIAVLAALTIGSFLLLVSVTFPEGNRTFSAIQNFGHFLLFVCLAFISLPIVHRLVRGRMIVALVAVSTGLMLFGLGVELFQRGLANRSASISDFMLDVLGVAVGFLVFFLIRLYRQDNKYPASVAALFALLATLVAVKPLIPLIGFDLLRPKLPVVRDFDHRFAVQKIGSHGGALFEKRATPELSPHTGCCSLQVTFSSARYSGVIFEEDASVRSGSWSDFEELNIKVFSSLRNNRQISLRINDRLHNNQFADRYNRPLSISPGLNEIIVPLQQLVTMGRGTDSGGRNMDIDDITHIQLFASEIEIPFKLEILSIELN